MKKRIGTKVYDTEKGIPVIPEAGLYKQPNKRTFYIFDGEKITPLEYDQAAEMIRGAGNPELLELLEKKPNNRGCASLTIALQQYKKLETYARCNGVSMKSVIEDYIDSLSIEE